MMDHRLQLVHIIHQVLQVLVLDTRVQVLGTRAHQVLDIRTI